MQEYSNTVLAKRLDLVGSCNTRDIETRLKIRDRRFDVKALHH
jgi:hypothetical protein